MEFRSLGGCDQLIYRLPPTEKHVYFVGLSIQEKSTFLMDRRERVAFIKPINGVGLTFFFWLQPSGIASYAFCFADFFKKWLDFGG